MECVDRGVALGHLGRVPTDPARVLPAKEERRGELLEHVLLVAIVVHFIGVELVVLGQLLVEIFAV